MTRTGRRKQKPTPRQGAPELTPKSVARMDVGDAVYRLVKLLARYPDERLDAKARGALEKTLPALDALRASHPDHPQVAWVAGMILRKLGRLDEAAQLARRAFELEPTFATAVSLAYALRERGDIDAAQGAFEAAARLDPEDVSARCDLGAMLCEAGRTAEGLRHLEAVLDEQPAHAVAFPAYAYHRAVRDGDASWYDKLAAYEKAHPESAAAARALERLRAEGLHHPAPVAVVEGFIAGVAEAIDHRHRDHDPWLDRFGAREHGYRLLPPLAPEELRRIEASSGARTPADYAAFLTRVGSAGAGPYYGLLPLDGPGQIESLTGDFPHTRPYRPQLRVMSASERAAYQADATVRGTIALAHMGCGYFSVLVVRGPRAGTVWADLRAAGSGLLPTHDSFTAWYRGWIEALSKGAPAELPISAPRCATPAAISDYLMAWERERRLPPGTAGEAGVRQALRELPDGAIAIQAEASRYFDAGDPISPCPSCRHMFDHFIQKDMLRAAQIRPGVPPRAARRIRPEA
ncbi:MULTISPECIES: lipopolysaccharide assembly protein LapB [Sorangium]|uniref:tetratricopeptide repeat protein n=1 Tax=Sorangium TaxID=39643 RepID=UPI00101AA2FD|nr:MULTISPECIES: tetratricopeptide repeat protein [Sorangium]